ncbi:MAG: MFS transporter [Acidimicrobiales bacterium]
MLLVSTAMFRATQNMAQTTFSLLGREDLGLKAGTLGLLAALAGLAMVVVTLRFASRVAPGKARAAAAAGSLVLAGALAVFVFASSLGPFAAAVIALGIAGGVGFPALTSAFGSAEGAQREQALALFALTLSASLAIGPLMETLVLDVHHQDLRAPFAVFVVFPLLGAALLARPARRSKRMSLSGGGESKGTIGDAAPGAIAGTGPEPGPSGIGPSGAGRAAWSQARRPRLGLELWQTPGGRLALTAQLLYAVPFAGVTVFGALVARVAFGVTPGEAQLAFTAFFATSFAARALVVWRAPVARKRAVFQVSGAMTVTGLVLLGVGHGLPLLLVAMAVLGLPHGFTFPLALALVAEAAPPGGLTRANAVLLGASNLTGVIAPVVLGALVQPAGYRGMVLLILVPVVAFGALLWS